MWSTNKSTNPGRIHQEGEQFDEDFKGTEGEEIAEFREELARVKREEPDEMGEGVPDAH